MKNLSMSIGGERRSSSRQGSDAVNSLGGFVDKNPKAVYSGPIPADHVIDEHEEETFEGSNEESEEILPLKPDVIGSGRHARSQSREDMLGTSPSQRGLNRSSNPKVSFAARANTTSGASDRPVQPPAPVTYRERLGGYLHPRDMRRLVTPFSTSNEPELIVRRHVMLLNFDPLRAVVLRDRLLVLVPDGADSILETLSQRIKGGLSEMEDSVFGKEHNSSIKSSSRHPSFDDSKASSRHPSFDDSKSAETEGDSSYGALPAAVVEKKRQKRTKKHHIHSMENFDRNLSDDENSDDSDTELDVDDFEDDEWGDMQGKEWAALPFELQSVDAVLHTVSAMLTDEANDLQEDSYGAIDQILDGQAAVGEHGHDIMRSLKGEIARTTARVQGFIRAINLVLDEDEDMALMNLSRLITHPERFIQPVSEDILHEESDEPELILEAFLQQSLSNTNALELLKSEVATTEELMNMKLDTVRNRLLYVNTVVSLLTLAVGVGSFIGSIFGMNLINPLEDSPTAFKTVVLCTCFGALGLLVALVLVFYKAGITLGGLQ
jgi:magnesium transporter